MQRVGGAVRTSLLRFAFPSFVFVLFASGLAPAVHAGELSWSLETRPADISVQRSPEGDRVLASGSNYQYVTAPGEPLLPYRVVSFLLAPGEAVVHTDLTAGDEVVVSRGVNLERAPLSPDANTAPPAASLAAGAGQVYPEQRVVSLGVGHLHGYAIASFAVYPVKVDAGAVSVNTSLQLRITTGLDVSGARIATRNRMRDDFRGGVERELSQLVVNPEQAALYSEGGVRVKKLAGGFQPTSVPSLEGSDVDYVIITNDSLAATFQILADWKTSKGVPTVVRTTEWIDAHYKNGVDPAETIRTFILDAYQDWGIRYVLLGGDTDEVPVRLGHSTYLGVKDLPADMYFGCLDGDWNADHDRYFGEPGTTDQTDLYPEVYTGRLPAVSNATAAAMIAKIESYETPLDPPTRVPRSFSRKCCFRSTGRRASPSRRTEPTSRSICFCLRSTSRGSRLGNITRITRRTRVPCPRMQLRCSRRSTRGMTRSTIPGTGSASTCRWATGASLTPTPMR
jgi:hypothetical protein